MPGKIPPQFDVILLKWVSENNQSGDSASLVIDRDTNLMDSAILDSVGLIEWFAFVEGKTGIKVDLAAMDHDQFSAILSISGLCHFLKQQDNGFS